MSKTNFTFNVTTETYNLQVTLDIESLNIHIENSYKVTRTKDIKQILDIIMNKPDFKKLINAGFTRSKSSLVKEWEAHNVMYKMSLFKNRTKSVDLNQGESKMRRAGYTILSIFHKK